MPLSPSGAHGALLGTGKVLYKLSFVKWCHTKKNWSSWCFHYIQLENPIEDSLLQSNPLKTLSFILLLSSSQSYKSTASKFHLHSPDQWSRPIPVKLSITFQRNIHYESSGLCDDMAQTHLDAIISLCCCFPAVLPLFFIYPESYVWSFIGKMNYDWPYIPHFPAHHHGFQSFSQWLSKLWVNSFTNQLATRCHPNLAFILQPPTCHLYYVRAAFPSPGLPSQAQEHQKPHANNQPAWQRTSWKKRIIPETTAPRNRTATQLHGYNNWGQHVLLDPRYRPWLIKVIFSLTAPEERQHSEPGEFLRQKERPDHKDAECTLGIQTPWPPAPLNSHVTLGKSVTPSMTHSQSANWVINSTHLIGLLIYIKCIETAWQSKYFLSLSSLWLLFHYLLFFASFGQESKRLALTGDYTPFSASNISNIQYPFKPSLWNVL